MKRWLIYALAGMLFGVFDFYYQEITSGLIHSYITWFLIAWVIWLVPAIPIVLYELKVSKSKIKAALANVFTWVITTISYYFFLLFKLVFIGQIARAEMHISNHKSEYYWSNLKNVFLGDVLTGIAEWVVVAIVGGFVFGFLFCMVILHFRKDKTIQL